MSNQQSEGLNARLVSDFDYLNEQRMSKLMNSCLSKEYLINTLKTLISNQQHEGLNEQLVSDFDYLNEQRMSKLMNSCLSSISSTP
jgi:hypothetical protein